MLVAEFQWPLLSSIVHYALQYWWVVQFWNAHFEFEFYMLLYVLSYMLYIRVCMLFKNLMFKGDYWLFDKRRAQIRHHKTPLKTNTKSTFLENLTRKMQISTKNQHHKHPLKTNAKSTFFQISTWKMKFWWKFDITNTIANTFKTHSKTNKKQHSYKFGHEK